MQLSRALLNMAKLPFNQCLKRYASLNRNIGSVETSVN